jgi:predicted XRE-type DNA-binding protein
MPRNTATTDSEQLMVTASSGNVFADLRLPSRMKTLLKSELARQIGELIQDYGWTQMEAAEAIGVDQPKVSALLRYRLSDFFIDRLVTLLDRLGQEIELVVKSKGGVPQAGTRTPRGGKDTKPISRDPAARRPQKRKRVQSSRS